MNTISSFILKLIIPISAAIISFSSCTDENEFKQNNTLPDAPEGFVNIEFDLNSGAFHKPETKAIRADSDFDAPWVLSFKLLNQGSPRPDTLFVEAVKAEMAGGKYYMQLSGSADPHLLYFVANADKVIENKKSLFATKTYGQVMSLLTFGNPSPDANFGLIPLSNPQGSVPFANQNIPMTATAQLDKVVKGTKVPGTVNLQRIVSKIYINATKANQKNGFVLTGLTVIDVPSIGYMNNELNIQSVQPQSIIDYGRKTGSDRLTTLVLDNIENNTTHSPGTDRPVYVYPFLENDPRGGVYQVIFSGHFGDNITKYFKIKLGGLNNPGALNKPNTSFLINIESIANNGYISLAHALQFEPSTGVVTKVTLIDQAHDIIADGKYFLGLSNSEFQLYADGEQRGVTVATITTNAFNSGGTAPTTRIELVSGTNLSLGAGQTISSNSTDIKVDFNDAQTATGTIRVTIGDLTRDILIKKDWAITGNFKTGDEGFLIASDIISAQAADNNPRIGLGTTQTSSERNQSLQSSAGTAGYLFIKNTIDEDILEVRALTATGRTILVRNMTNIPEFAGNNIYWDTMKQYKFDNYSTAHNNGTLNIQGVMFLTWGSLVSLPGSTRPITKGEIKVPNNSNQYDNFTSFLPSQLPETTLSDFLTHNKIPMIPDENKGDICEFMTRRGLTPSNKKGTKWSLPTNDQASRLPRRFSVIGTNNSEIFPNQAIGLTDKNGTSLTNIYINCADLFYFTPTAFWSDLGQPNGLYTNSLTYTKDGYLNSLLMHNKKIYVSKPSTQNIFGSVSRCVRDDSPGAIVPLYKIEYDLTPEPNETIGNQTKEVQLAKFVDQGESFTLSNTKLTTTEAGEHTGWIVNGREYALGATISGINSDITIKPKWDYIKLAGSNIYWDGTKLTFDDVPTVGYTPHAKYQGVYFRWG